MSRILRSRCRQVLAVSELVILPALLVLCRPWKVALPHLAQGRCFPALLDAIRVPEHLGLESRFHLSGNGQVVHNASRSDLVHGHDDTVLLPFLQEWVATLAAFSGIEEGAVLTDWTEQVYGHVIPRIRCASSVLRSALQDRKRAQEN